MVLELPQACINGYATQFGDSAQIRLSRKTLLRRLVDAMQSPVTCHLAARNRGSVGFQMGYLDVSSEAKNLKIISTSCETNIRM